MYRICVLEALHSVHFSINYVFNTPAKCTYTIKYMYYIGFQTYVITKRNNIFKHTKKFSLKMSQQTPKHAGEKGDN